MDKVESLEEELGVLGLLGRCSFLRGSWYFFGGCIILGDLSLRGSSLILDLSLLGGHSELRWTRLIL